MTNLDRLKIIAKSDLPELLKEGMACLLHDLQSEKQAGAKDAGISGDDYFHMAQGASIRLLSFNGAEAIADASDEDLDECYSWLLNECFHIAEATPQINRLAADMARGLTFPSADYEKVAEARMASKYAMLHCDKEEKWKRLSVGDYLEYRERMLALVKQIED